MLLLNLVTYKLQPGGMQRFCMIARPTQKFILIQPSHTSIIVYVEQHVKTSMKLACISPASNYWHLHA